MCTIFPTFFKVYIYAKKKEWVVKMVEVIR